MDRRIVNNVLSSFEKKVIKQKEIKDRFKEILQKEFDENIICNLRQNKDIIYIMLDYYYIVTPNEKSNHYVSYSTNEMVYEVLNKQKIKWYHGLDSALEYHQIIWQGVVNPVIINNYISGRRVINNVKYKFHKIKDELFDFGIIKLITKNNIKFYYSDMEKTYLDYLYLKKKAPQDLKKRIEWKPVKKYLKKYPRTIKQRVFYQ